MSTIAPTAKIHPNVKLGKNVTIGDYVIIGEPVRTKDGKVLTTKIGDGAVIRSHTVIYAGNVIGKNFQTGHGVLVRESNKIGNNVSVGSSSTIEHHVAIGNGVRIHSNAFIPEFSHLKKGCWIGPGVVLTNASYPLSARAKTELRGPVIGEGAKIGGNSSLLPGVVIGNNTLVGAGSVVVGNLSKNKVAIGNPAREIKNMKQLEAYKPILERIPLNDLKAQYRSISAEVDRAIRRVLESGSYILGKEVQIFEKAFAAHMGTKFAVGVSSGTSAIQLALEALGVKAGDEVITTTFTFIATAEGIRHAGATPVLVDIDPVTLCISPTLIEKAITKKTKAIVVVHIHGHPAEMDAIMRIARKHRLVVVEDAAQAHGARYKGRVVGSIGDAGCFSFFPAKNLGAYGDAGAVITNNKTIAERVALLRDHGRKEKYRHDFHGYNHRIDPLQTAILSVKLPYLETWNEKRRQIAETYSAALKDLIPVPESNSEALPVYHQFVVRTKHRDALQAALADKGIDTGVHYPIPLHLQPALSYLKYKKGRFPNAEKASQEVLSLPIYPEMLEEQVAWVIRSFKDALTLRGKRGGKHG